MAHVETVKSSPESCTCDRCVSNCELKPGWFVPGEAEQVATHLGISLEELFRTRLQVDWWHRSEGAGGSIFLLTPWMLRGDEERPGEIVTFRGHGRCTFLTPDGRCEIHPVKPRECRESFHEETPRELHHDVAFSWDSLVHQGQIRALLGEEPVPPEPTLLEGLSFLFSQFER